MLDTFTPPGPCSDSSACPDGSGLERFPTGPQYHTAQVVTVLGVPGAYLSIVCWNGGDNTFDSVAAIDNIAIGGPQLRCLAPTAAVGPGSLAIENLGMT